MRSFIRKLSSRLFFRMLYLKKPPWDSGIAPPELVEFTQADPPGRSLDLGCGTGTNVLYLRQHGWEASGVDFVPSAVREGRRKARQAGLDVNLSVGDVSDPAVYQGAYDLILDMGCYHTLNPAQRARYRQLVAGHLADGGTYMLYGFMGEDSRITPEDVAAFEDLLTLKKRVDSADPSGPASAWFWWGKK